MTSHTYPLPLDGFSKRIETLSPRDTSTQHLRTEIVMDFFSLRIPGDAFRSS